MTARQWDALEREVARLQWQSLLNAETRFEPRPAPHFRTLPPDAVSLEEWVSTF